MILNEYNAVGDDQFLNGGDEIADDDGGQKSDTFFGRVAGNGGNWFELVVIAESLDIRGWQVLIDDDNGANQVTLTFTEDDIWSNLGAGTIITVAEGVPDDVSYDPDTGDWWIQVQASTSGTGTYISASDFEVSNIHTQFEILDGDGTLIFGPAGESIGSGIGVNSREVFKLETDPSALIRPESNSYNDGTSSSFGSPNIYGGGEQVQDFSALRSGPPEFDQDFDDIADCEDNFPEQPNLDQTDTDGDDFGDACDPDQGGMPGPGLPPDGCDEFNLFDPNRIVEVEVLISQADWDALRTQRRPFADIFGGDCAGRPPTSPFEFFQAISSSMTTAWKISGCGRRGLSARSMSSGYR